MGGADREKGASRWTFKLALHGIGTNGTSPGKER